MAGFTCEDKPMPTLIALFRSALSGLRALHRSSGSIRVAIRFSWGEPAGDG